MDQFAAVPLSVAVAVTLAGGALIATEGATE
jgi:hypothetical protein